jgi:large repetitive protein
MTYKNYSSQVFLLTLLLALCAAPAAAQLGNFIITTPDLPDGTAGQFYSATLQTAGGFPPITFSIMGGSLPPGINLSSSGVISGTPTSGGFYNFTVQAVDSLAGAVQTTSKSFSIYVYAVITVSPAVLPNVVVNSPFSIQLSASGGTAPYFFGFNYESGEPYPWLSLTSGGVLSGTPPSTGNFTVNIYVYDQSESYAEKSYTLVVGPALSITTATLPDATVNQPYSMTLAAAGGTSPYTFTIVQGSLPQQLNMSSNGVISGTPLTAGSSNFTARVTDSAARTADRVFTLVVQPPPVDFTPTTLPTGTVNAPYSASFTPTGVGGGYVFSAPSGGLPQGLTLSSTGNVSGTPTTSGSFLFNVRLVYGNFTIEKMVSLEIVIPPLSIGSPTLPEGVTGQPYSASMSATGGVPPYSFSVTGGALPPGLALSAGGAISGSPTASGTSQFSVTVNDSGNRQASALFTIVVLDPLALAPDTLPSAALSVPYDVQLQATGGAPPYTFSISGDLPPGISFSGGLFSGLPTAPGVYQPTVTLTDSGQRQVVRNYRLVVPSNIQITTTSPLTQSTVGQPFTATFTATDGVPDYQWSSIGGLPPGLSLDPATGVLSGQPTKSGTFTFGITVIDTSEGTDTRTFSVTFVLPPLPVISYTQIGTSAGPAQQPGFGLSLSQGFPVPLTGQVRLSFAPDRFADDPAVLFANGSRAMPFSIPAGQQTADFGSILAALQTGTVAGTITLEASLSADEQDVTPSPAPRHTIRIAAMAPVISRLELNRTSNGFELVVTGYSTPRQLTQVNIKLTPASGSAIATSDFTLPVDSIFTSYYSGSGSTPYGSQFRLVIPFFVPQGLNGLASVSVTLTNPVGSSNTASANF